MLYIAIKAGYELDRMLCSEYPIKLLLAALNFIMRFSEELWN